MSRLLDIVGRPRWATAKLIAVGLLSSLAETIGITLILVFVYSAMGQIGVAGEGWMHDVLVRTTAWFGSTTNLAAIIMMLIVARGLLAMAYGRLSSEIGERISERTRNLIHHRYLSMSYGTMQSQEQAFLMEVLGSESWMVATVYGAWTRVIINACSIAVFVLVLLAVSWKITVVATVCASIISIGLRQLAAPARTLGQLVRQSRQYLGEHMLMTLQGMRTIRAYGQEEVHQKRFVASSSDAREVTTALVRLSSWISPLTEVGYLIILCLIIAGSNYWHTGFAITLGAVAILYRLQPHTREFEANLLFIAQVQPQLRSVREMLEVEGKTFASEGHLPIKELANAIEFRDVRFRYHEDDALVLDDVSFRIPAGQTTAIVGASGSGKTTLVNILLRLYAPQEGAILVDGVPLDAIKRTDWLSLLAVAGQDVDLVEGTVIDNIRMAANDASDEQVFQAADEAGVAEFITPLHEGYETWIGQEGLRFSGGQRQRIGLARALVRAPDILILDEAMSALDRGLEDRVRAAVNARLAGRTMLIITHRLETVRNVNHVVWIEEGRVRAMGPPAEVLNQAEAFLNPGSVGCSDNATVRAKH